MDSDDLKTVQLKLLFCLMFLVIVGNRCVIKMFLAIVGN